MKNFKKSLLVVPALGVLMLAAAGSVGGTVAWFSSANTFNTDVSSFAVGRLNGDLSCTMDAGTGTMKKGDVIIVRHNDSTDDGKEAILTHGSYDHSISVANKAQAVSTITSQSIGTPSGTFVSEGGGVVTVNRENFLSQSKQRNGTYTFTFNGTNWTVAGAATGSGITTAQLQSLWGINLSKTAGNGQTVIITLTNTYAADTDWAYDSNPVVKVVDAVNVNTFWYYAVSWTMTFSYSFGSDTAPRNIYFNMDDSSITPTHYSGDNEATLKSYKGFRIGFKTDTRAVVWAPEQDTIGDIHYVKKQDSTYVEADYPNDDNNFGLVYSGLTSSNQANDSSKEILIDTATQGKQGTSAINWNYIGQLTSVNASLPVTCVAWFEGTDPNVVNAAELHSVAAALHFFAVPHQAA